MNCTEIPGQYTCNSTNGEKVCESHWTGTQCDTCKSNYFGDNCDVFCEQNSAWNCSDSGEKECLGHFTGNNCTGCKKGWYGSKCDVFCEQNSKLWTCDQNGNKICNGNRRGTTVQDWSRNLWIPSILRSLPNMYLIYLAQILSLFLQVQTVVNVKMDGTEKNVQ